MKYYVLCSDPNGDLWFAFADGSSYNTATFKNATETTDLLEAYRMLGYARENCPKAKIVTVDIQITNVDQFEIDDELYRNVRDKLSDDEFTLINQRVIQSLSIEGLKLLIDKRKKAR